MYRDLERPSGCRRRRGFDRIVPKMYRVLNLEKYPKAPNDTKIWGRNGMEKTMKFKRAKKEKQLMYKAYSPGASVSEQNRLHVTWYGKKLTLSRRTFRAVF